MAARTTLSYSVLGLLALRPMSAYELVQGYLRNLGQVMSRSEAAIYAEPKRLEVDGLVARSDEVRGKRTVPIYSITDVGRAELRDWLATPTGFPQIDAEPALRVVFADQGDPAHLRATIITFREQAMARAVGLHAIASEYRDGVGLYQQRALLAAMSGRFVTDLIVAYLRWCDWALDELDELDRGAKTATAGALTSTAAQAYAIDAFAEIADLLASVIDARPDRAR